MSDHKDYSSWALDELIEEEKKYKNKERLSSGIIGFLVGVMLYGLFNNGFRIVFILILSFLIYGVYKNSKTNKESLQAIQKAIQEKRPD